MAIPEVISGFLSPNFMIAGGAIIILIILAIWVWRAIRNWDVQSATGGEKGALKGVGFLMSGAVYSGAALYRTLRWGIRGTGKLAKAGLKKGGTKLTKDFAKYTTKLLRGEEMILEEELH